MTNPVKHVEFFREVGRTRIISPQEEKTYQAATSQPLRDVARIMLDTGMRRRKCFGLKLRIWISFSGLYSIHLERRLRLGANWR